MREDFNYVMGLIEKNNEVMEIAETERRVVKELVGSTNIKIIRNLKEFTHEDFEMVGYINRMLLSYQKGYCTIEGADEIKRGTKNTYKVKLYDPDKQEIIDVSNIDVRFSIEWRLGKSDEWDISPYEWDSSSIPFNRDGIYVERFANLINLEIDDSVPLGTVIEVTVFVESENNYDDNYEVDYKSIEKVIKVIA